MSNIQFPSLIAKATVSRVSPYALDNVLVTPQGDAVATDGNIMAIVQARHWDGESVDDKGRKTDIPAAASVMIPSKLGPSKSADTRAVFSVNGDASKTDHKGAKTSLPAGGGRFPRCYDVLPDIQQCREITLRPKQLVRLMESLNSPGGENADHITLLVQDDPNVAIGVVSGTYDETKGIGVVMPFVETNTKHELYTLRRAELERLTDALTDFHREQSE